MPRKLRLEKVLQAKDYYHEKFLDIFREYGTNKGLWPDEAYRRVDAIWDETRPFSGVVLAIVESSQRFAKGS